MKEIIDEILELIYGSKPKKKRKLNNKAALPMSDSDDESSDEYIQS